ncbi:MAG: membrane-bound PQQ-dependent dehydrogenase, glucose/quinate/shikimate family, partial [Anaerolineales bacterium]
MVEARTRDRGFGFWLLVATGVTILVFGLPILGGGVWLAYLGGSWYYMLAGLGLLITSLLLFRRSIFAVWVYLLTFAGTVVWALWEAGFDGWAQVPRLVAPSVVLVLILALIPVLRGRSARRVNKGAAGFAGALALVASIGILNITPNGGDAQAQDQTLQDDEARMLAPVETDPTATSTDNPELGNQLAPIEPANDAVDATDPV